MRNKTKAHSKKASKKSSAVDKQVNNIVDTEKLQKVLAAQGLGSRRSMEQWIVDGRVLVNGLKASLGDRVGLRDKIAVDGAVIYRTEHNESVKLLQYNKPEGRICSRDDPKGRPSVFENLPKLQSGRWLSVGRLDLNTSGLLLFTNNGELANKLMHPSTGVLRRYMARIRGKLTDAELKQIVGQGVELDGKMAKFHDVVVVEREDNGANHWVEVGIEEGRNREVRRIFEALGHPVSRLKRISYGDVTLMPNVRLGHAKEMAPLQIEKMLKHLGLDEFVPKVRPHKDEKKTKASTRSQNARGSKEAVARSMSDKLSFKEQKNRKRKSRAERAAEWSSEKPKGDKKSLGRSGRRKKIVSKVKKR